MFCLAVAGAFSAVIMRTVHRMKFCVAIYVLVLLLFFRFSVNFQFYGSMVSLCISSKYMIFIPLMHSFCMFQLNLMIYGYYFL